MFEKKKSMLSSHFNMNDLSETSYVMDIQIFRERFKDLFGLSRKTYIDQVLNRFYMHYCFHVKVHIVKVDKFFKSQCL